MLLLIVWQWTINVLRICLGLETQILHGPSFVIKSTRQDCIMCRFRIRLKLGLSQAIKKKNSLLWKGLFIINQRVFYKTNSQHPALFETARQVTPSSVRSTDKIQVWHAPTNSSEAVVIKGAIYAALAMQKEQVVIFTTKEAFSDGNSLLNVVRRIKALGCT